MQQEHDVEITKRSHESPEIPDAWHMTCRCGWAATVHEEQLASVLAGEHLANPELPAPASPSPIPLSQ